MNDDTQASIFVCDSNNVRALPLLHPPALNDLAPIKPESASPKNQTGPNGPGNAVSAEGEPGAVSYVPTPVKLEFIREND